MLGRRSDSICDLNRKTRRRLLEGTMSEQAVHSDGLSFLRAELKGHIYSFKQRVEKNRRQAFLAKFLVAVLGALTTILLGLKSNPLFADQDNWFSAVALVLSAGTTVIATWDAFFDHRWLWIRYTSTLVSLYSISDDLEYAAANTNSMPKAELDGLYGRLQEALKDTNAAWVEKRAKEDVSEGGPARK